MRHNQTISDRHPDTHPWLVGTLQLPRQPALVLLYPHQQKVDPLWNIKAATSCPFHSVYEKYCPALGLTSAFQMPAFPCHPIE